MAAAGLESSESESDEPSSLSLDEDESEESEVATSFLAAPLVALTSTSDSDSDSEADSADSESEDSDGGAAFLDFLDGAAFATTSLAAFLLTTGACDGLMIDPDRTFESCIYLGLDLAGLGIL